MGNLEKEIAVIDFISGLLMANGKRIVDVAAESGFASSKTQARQLIKQGAIKINQTKIQTDKASVTSIQGYTVLVEDFRSSLGGEIQVDIIPGNPAIIKVTNRGANEGI